MFVRGKIIWSPVEIDYLREHYKSSPLTQLSIALSKSLNAIKKKINELEGRPVKTSSKKARMGKREDLGGVYLRSSWEANSIRFIHQKLKLKWQYEPRLFVFDKIKKGTISYLPDIYLPEKDLFVEVKGHLTQKGKTAIKRFKQYYPEEFKKLRAVVGSQNTVADKFFKEIGVPILFYYNEIKKLRAEIQNWE